MTPLTRASVGLEPTRSGRCPAHTTNPTVTLSSSTDFPGSPVIRPTLLPPISRRDEEGFSSCATRPVSPCCHFHPAGVTNRLSQVTVRHAVFASRLQARPPSVRTFGATSAIRLRYGPVTRCHPEDGLVDGLQRLGFPPPCHPSYKALAFTLAGLTPAERVRLRWTHNRTGGSPASGSRTRSCLRPWKARRTRSKLDFVQNEEVSRDIAPVL